MEELIIALRTEPKSKIDLLRFGQEYVIRVWEKAGPFAKVVDVRIHKFEMVRLVAEVLDDLGVAKANLGFPEV